MTCPNALPEVDCFFGVAAIPLCVLEETRFRQLNPAWESELGLVIAELQETSFLDWVHPHDRATVALALQHCQSSTAAVTIEVRGRCQGDSYRWFLWTMNRVDKTRLIYASAQDISERRAAEEALKEAESRYRNMFENAVAGIFQTTPDGAYLDVNRALARIYGYQSPEELKAGLTDIEHQLYVDPSRRAEFAQLLQIDDAVCDFESEIYRKDGQVIWISENARAVRDESGQISYYEGTVEDITRRKVAEQSLRESEAKNRALLNAIPDMMFRIHLSGQCLDFKPPTRDEGVFAVEDYLGKPLQEFLPLEVSQQHLHHVRQVLLSGTPQVFEYEWAVTGEVRDYEARLVANGTQEVLAIVRDITERKKVERLKNEFVSIVSHELRTPLTSIRGSLGLIVGGVAGELPAQAKTMVDIAYKNSERLVLLINDILDIEKIESGKMHFDIKPLALVPLVEQAIESNRAYGEQFGVKFVLDCQVSAVEVMADSNRLLQVLTNLLSNAAKFSPTNESVLITISRQSRQIRVSVSDCGPGIPLDFQSRIFQKFAQADSSSTRQKGGTGLGLSISKAIIEKLGGQIGFETELNQGTTFYFVLPEWVNPSQPVTFPLSELPQSAHILICEDNPDIATLLRLILEQGGFTADVAYDAAQAKQMVLEHRYDAMTVDLVLPGQDGISLIKELRECEATRYLPIVVVSANAQQEQGELTSPGFAVVDCLEKPIDQHRLIAVVRQAVSQRTDRKPQILHVEDDVDILQVIATILQDVADITAVTTLKQGIEQIRHQDFDLVILDLNLPDGFGLELMPYLSQKPGLVTPIVVFSAQELEWETAQRVTVSLVKSRTSNQELLETIKSLIQVSHAPL